MSTLNCLSARRLRQLIAAKQISPRDLLADCMAAVAELNGAVNAIVATDYEAAGQAAAAAEAKVMAGEPLGMLHGLPVGIKDLHATKGLRTTFGSRIYADHVPDEDDGLVARLRHAGAIITAKTNTPEFGAGANTTNLVYGATVTPFDVQRTSGGSSGGSAAALALDMLPLCSGSDMGGSLRIPAAFCGVVGFRPSPGLVPRSIGASAWSPLGVSGPMARSVDDLALMLAAMVGFDARDALAVSDDPARYLHPDPADLSQLKVAVSCDLGFAPIDSRTRQAFDAVVAALGDCFAVVDQVDPPLEHADFIFNTQRALSFVAAHRAHLRDHADLLGANVRDNLQQGLALNVEDIARADALAAELYRNFVGFMQDYDILLSPTVGAPPFDVRKLYLDEIDGMKMKNYFHWLAATYGITVTAHPAISLPAGLDTSGAPFGLQITGRRRQDARLLNIAAAVEAVLAGGDWARPFADKQAIAGTDGSAAGCLPPL